MAMRQGVEAWIAHEAGPVRTRPGERAPFADSYSVSAAVIATLEARLADGRTLLTGHVSRANKSAEGLGVRPGGAAHAQSATRPVARFRPLRRGAAGLRKPQLL